jgi:exopolyphosphatase/guanosine-5'-triphosphate,3'-diphosphate pyrophosphatase
MRLACIDIGTNTTRLLVAEPDDGGLREVLTARVYTPLGHVRRHGEVGAELTSEVAAAVASHVEDARAAGASWIGVVATAAAREARDCDKLLAAVTQASGVVPTLLSGEDEARLAFVGATRALTLAPASTVGVIDVGGGSTELAVGTPALGASWCLSLPLGSAVITAELLHDDPPTEAQLRAAEQQIAEAVAGLDPPACERVLAVGGSATSLLHLGVSRLGPAELKIALARVVCAPSAELAPALGLDPRRVRLLGAGVLILLAAAGTLKSAPTVVAGGLREGVILERLRRCGPQASTGARPS